MTWDKEDLEKIQSLLMSNDEHNILLAIQLLATHKKAEPLAEALALVEALHENEEIVLEAKIALEKYISVSKRKACRDELKLLKEVWNLSKDDFLEALKVYEEKIAIYEGLMKQNPIYSVPYTSVASRLNSSFRKKTMSLCYLKKRVELDPSSMHAHFDYAYGLPESKKNAAAIIYHYQACFDLGMRSRPIYHNLGRAYAQYSTDFEKAKKVFREAIQTFPDLADTMIELALILNSEGNYQETEELLEQAIQLEPNNHLALNNIACLYWEDLKDYKKAKKSIEKALKLSPRVALYWHTYAEVEWYGFQRKKEAISALEKAITLSKNYKPAKDMLLKLTE